MAPKSMRRNAEIAAIKAANFEIQKSAGGHIVVLKFGHQSFWLNGHAPMSRREAVWMIDQAANALYFFKHGTTA